MIQKLTHGPTMLVVAKKNFMAFVIVVISLPIIATCLVLVVKLWGIPHNFLSLNGLVIFMYSNPEDWGFVNTPCNLILDNTDHCQESECQYKTDCICWQNFVSDLGDTLPEEAKL